MNLFHGILFFFTFFGKHMFRKCCFGLYHENIYILVNLTYINYFMVYSFFLLFCKHMFRKCCFGLYHENIYNYQFYIYELSHELFFYFFWKTQFWSSFIHTWCLFKTNFKTYKCKFVFFIYQSKYIYIYTLSQYLTYI